MGDQEGRKDLFKNGDPPRAQIDALGEADKKRRQRVLELVSQQKLVTGPDYYHAAMILQHSVEDQHFLVGHVLATIAALKGHEPGKWLFAASLDRFLHRIDRPQIFGTQWRWGSEKPRTYTMEAYATNLLTDAIRREYNVHTLAEQAKKTEEMNRRPQ